MKVLIISHNATSNINNMGKTLKALFSTFEKEELCQLYVYPSIPDADICSSYYRITDKSVLKGYFSLQAPGKKISEIKRVNNENGILEHEKDSAIYGKKSNQTAVKRLLRDIMWKFSRWDSKGLHEWLAEEKPTCIFLAPGYAKFIYDIAMKISKRLDIPIITYICDDYYFVKPPKSLAGRIQLNLLKKKIDALMNRSTQLVVICEELKNAYSAEFCLPVSVVMTGSDMKRTLRCNKANTEIRNLCYFGNLSCNRHLPLCEIGHALEKINVTYDVEIKLNIYSDEGNEELLSSLRKIEAVTLCGFVTGPEFERAILSSDMLIHVEAFDEESIDLVKYSVSTKIAESLASGIPLFAYGPEHVASMQHLIRNQCAIVSTNKESLFLTLENALIGEFPYAIVVDNAVRTAQEYHNLKENGETIKMIVMKSIYS